MSGSAEKESELFNKVHFLLDSIMFFLYNQKLSPTGECFGLM